MNKHGLNWVLLTQEALVLDSRLVTASCKVSQVQATTNLAFCMTKDARRALQQSPLPSDHLRHCIQLQWMALPSVIKHIHLTQSRSDDNCKSDETWPRNYCNEQNLKNDLK